MLLLARQTTYFKVVFINFHLKIYNNTKTIVVYYVATISRGDSRPALATPFFSAKGVDFVLVWMKEVRSFSLRITLGLIKVPSCILVSSKVIYKGNKTIDPRFSS
ncbi:hypothetical protein CC80DRAFT_511155 [Byssothecium circinans]|uniref:Uncharacterized protein n=1 Tax=Byssothecium circinans TaxID=147558 RepID=A0A6A5T7V7_9PLEO|nr:hypothetical protein CC80DRAFT_511155 [Byssothecium circinans]